MADGLSVLITYHNEGELLERCLASVMAQTRPVHEVLIFDDASAVRPEPFIPAGARARVVRSDENVGPGRGRNVLFQQSTGAFVHFHDADDAFTPTWHERVRAEFERERADVVFTEVSSIDTGGARHGDVLGVRTVKSADDLVRACMRGAMLVPSATYRRETFERLGGYRAGLWQSEDWDFHVRLACAGVPFAVIPEPLVEIHIRAASRSQKRTEVWTSALKAIEALATELPARFLGELAEAAARVGSTLYRLGCPAEARRGFALARRIGPARFVHEGRAYQALARIAGQETAERLGALYRAVLPVSVRSAVNAVDRAQ